MDCLLSFENPKDVANFISTTESGIYAGINEDDEKVIVLIAQGQGMSVKTKQSNGWWIVHNYSKDGYVEDETFER